MTDAGNLNRRLVFQEGVAGTDTWGNPIAGNEFIERFKLWAEMKPLRGTEEVTAARLSGRQPYFVRVYRNSLSRQITTSWRAVDARDPERVFAITSPAADPDGAGQFLEFLVVEGAPP